MEKRPTVWLRHPRLRVLFLAFSGILTGLTVIYPKLGVLEWLSLIPAMLVLYDIAQQEEDGEGIRLRRVYAMGLLFFMCYYLMNFHFFLAMYPLEFTDLSRGAALFVVMFAWWGLSLFQALGAAFVFVAFIAFSRSALVRRLSFLRIFLLGALWIILEWGQTLFWSGVPWGRLALGQVETPVMIATASLLGSYIISLCLVLFNATVAYAVLHTDRLRLCAFVCGGILLFQAGGGVLITLRTTGNVESDRENTLRIAAIQGNIGSADKWDMSSEEVFLTYYDLTEQAAASGAELIVWPETAVPLTILEYPTYVGELSELAQKYQVTIFVGAFTENQDGEKYNSIIVFEQDGGISESVYSKRHLVPFGEYVPMRALVLTLVPPLANLVQADVLAGDDAAVYESAYGGIGSLICFDSIYEMLAIDSVRQGAELLTISTNDSWFFDSAAARMHNAQAQLRAVETGRWVIRAASTGISSIITPAGEIVARQDALTQGILTGTVVFREEMTLYTRVGNVVVWACMAYAVVLLAARVVERRKVLFEIRNEK
ncbi:MAG: apolipoprotein N-acyltransferase [Clostridia bacterium]|nr:apolipoprotein N-acyltransferase [Clostridia bacterium]